MKLYASQFASIDRIVLRARDTFRPARSRRSDYEIALTVDAQSGDALLRVNVAGQELPTVLELRVDRFGDCRDLALLEAHERMAAVA